MEIYQGTTSFSEIANIDCSTIFYELDNNLVPTNVIHSLTFTQDQSVKLAGVGGPRGFTIRDLTTINHHNVAPFNLEF